MTHSKLCCGAASLFARYCQGPPTGGVPCHAFTCSLLSWSWPISLHGAQVPLLTVMESVAPVRVPGRLPLFQVWFDIQPVSFEGSAALEDLDISPLSKVWLPCMHTP